MTNGMRNAAFPVLPDIQEAGRRSKPPRLLIVAGEASGDLHGGALAEALFKKNPSVQIIGFGGDAMRRAGVDVRFDIERLAVVGLLEVFLNLKSIVQAYRYALQLLREGVDLLVLIDYPGFNLRLAKSAKQLGIPVVYYVSPQIWAWHSGRIKTIAERVDQMLVILPFENEIYEAAGIPCKFVGHPLLDEVNRLGMPFSAHHSSEEKSLKRAYLAEKGLDPAAITIGLLPGSRRREVLALLPAMLRGMERLAKEFPGLQILIPVAPSLPSGLIHDLVRSCPLPIRWVEGEIYEVMRVSEVNVVASGTATLQGALAGTPMVIIYRLSWVSYQIARWLIRLKSVGLANIVAEAPFIPELIQKDASPFRISEEVGRLLKDKAAREKMRQGLKEVAGRLGTAGASDRAASVISRLMETAMQTKGNFRKLERAPDFSEGEIGRKSA
ncbi:MAG: lipid-A-disaccharide synthase [Nitrospiria bacterium]